jgi:hypothetical protein
MGYKSTATESGVLALCVALGALGSCNWYGNLWANASYGATSSGAGGNACAGMGGDGGEGGAGGDDEGAGGDDGSGGSGAGDSSAVSVGAGGSSGDTVGASVGAGAGDARSGWAEGHVARAPHHHRGRRGGIGSVRQAQCPGMAAWTFPPAPPLPPLPTGAVPLSTTRLRVICNQPGIGQGLTGIQFNNACGLQFEKWVLWTLQQPKNTTRIKSLERASNAGAPGVVIPDYVTDLQILGVPSMEPATIGDSSFGEVKAVTGNLTLGYSRWQILGLIDVARLSPATTTRRWFPQPQPQLLFITTGNTGIPGPTIQKATLWNVLMFQQMVYEVPAMPNDPNPDLCLGAVQPLNGWIAVPGFVLYQVPTTCSTLPSPPSDWVKPIKNDPDPPTVD